MASTDSYKYVEVHQRKLAYLELGDPSLPPLVLIHGQLSDLRSFQTIQPLLAKYFHVIAYSRRYAWPNDPIEDTEPEIWEQQAEDLAALIESLNLSPTHVLGSSSGGAIALLLAQKRPQLVKSLILAEPPLASLFLANTPPTLTDLLSLLWYHPGSFIPLLLFGGTVIGPVVENCKKGDYDAAMAIFGPGAYGAEAWNNFTPERMEQAKVNQKWFGNFFRYSAIPTLSVDQVSQIDVPALVLTGANTVWSTKHINSRLAQVLPQCSKEVVIPEAWHFSHEDQPEKVMEEVVAFVRGLK